MSYPLNPSSQTLYPGYPPTSQPLDLSLIPDLSKISQDQIFDPQYFNLPTPKDVYAAAQAATQRARNYASVLNSQDQELQKLKSQIAQRELLLEQKKLALLEQQRAARQAYTKAQLNAQSNDARKAYTPGSFTPNTNIAPPSLFNTDPGSFDYQLKLQQQLASQNLNTSNKQQILNTPQGQGWLNSPQGQSWLRSSPAAGNWLLSQSGQAWSASPGGQNWLSQPLTQAWLSSSPNGQEWLRSPSGQQWLSTTSGRTFQATAGQAATALQRRFRGIRNRRTALAMQQQALANQEYQKQDFFQKVPFSYILSNPPKLNNSISLQNLKTCLNPKTSSTITSNLSSKISTIKSILLQFNLSSTQQTSPTLWNFGNFYNQPGNPFPLMSNDQYSQLLNDLHMNNTNQLLLSSSNSQQQLMPQTSQYSAYLSGQQQSQSTMYNPTSSRYYGKEQIMDSAGNDYNYRISQINKIQEKLIGMDPASILCLVNTYFKVDMLEVFPAITSLSQQFSSYKNYSFKITLLGLAAMLGLEHIVLYFLTLGAQPNMINTRNEDSAFGMLQSQIILHRIITLIAQQTNPKQVGYQNQFLHSGPTGLTTSTSLFKPMQQGVYPVQGAAIIPQEYLITDHRMEYILTLLGSTGLGINLSLNSARPFDTSSFFLTSNVNKGVFSGTGGTLPVNYKSLLAELCTDSVLVNTNMIFGGDIANNDKANSIYNLLYFILSFNGTTAPVSNQDINPNQQTTLQLFADMNVQSIPFGFTPIYYLLGNRTLTNISQKIGLIGLMIQQGADPTIVPNVMQSSKSILPIFNDFCKLITFYYQGDALRQIKDALSQSPKFAKSKCIRHLTTMSGITNPIQYQQKLFDKGYGDYLGQLAQPEYSSQLSQLSQLGIDPTQLSEFVQTKPGYALMAGGKKKGGDGVVLRKFHFPKQETFHQRVFKANKPKVAAEIAYDFIKNHYNVDKNKITFKIEDRERNKVYKYSAKTKADGSVIVKSKD